MSMPEQNLTSENDTSRVGWFATAALVVVAAVALFLYADGYFDANAATDEGRVIIEGY